MNPVQSQHTELFFSVLDECGKFVVTSHTHPDGDACGCVTAMATFLKEKLGKEVTIVLPDNWGSGVDFLMKDYNIILASQRLQEAETAFAKADAIICLDFNTASRISVLENALRISKAKKILIDHHPGPEQNLFDIVFSDTEVSSACELLYWILLCHPATGGNASGLPAGSARSLMTGMTTDSNNFANSVFPSTLQMASGLLAAGVDREDILLNIYSSKRECVVRAWSYLMDRELTVTPEGIAFIVLSKETYRQFSLVEGDTDGLVNSPLSIGNVKISALLTEDDGFYRLSLRSKKDVSVGELARRHFHGGGHERASGGKIFFPADIPDKSEIKNYFSKITAQFLQEQAAV